MSKYKKQACICGHSKTIHTPINGARKRVCARLACDCEDYRSVPTGQVQKQPQFPRPSKVYVTL